MGMAFRGRRDDAIDEFRLEDPVGAANLEAAYAREDAEQWGAPTTALELAASRMDLSAASMEELEEELKSRKYIQNLRKVLNSMSKNAKKDGPAVQNNSESGPEVPVTNPDAVTLSAEGTKDFLKRLFIAYEAADGEVSALEEQVDAAVAVRSAAIKKISDFAGGGPFRFKGDELTISSRNNVYFFRGKRKERSAIEID